MMEKIARFNEEGEDWTFAGKNTKYLTHGFHPYPARMMPLIAKKIIEKYSKNCDQILDPFCGSGTVLVEAIVHNRNAIGFDINPLATLIAKAKTTPINPVTLKNKIIEVLDKISSDNNRYPKPVGIPNLDYWFKPEVIKELSKIRNHIKKIEKEEIYNFFAVAFSYCVWKVSNIRKSEYKLYRMPRDSLAKWNPNVLGIFREILHNNLRGMADFYKIMKNKKSKATVYLKDVRKCNFAEEVNLILTSPPYGDSKTTVAYGQFSRYSALWLGLKGVLNVDKISLGGIKKKGDVSKLESKNLEETFNKIYERDQERAWELYSYFYDMDISVQRLSKSLKRDGYMIFVIGNRTMRRVKIQTDEILTEIAKKYGFEHEKTIYREIPSKRIPWENAPENIPGKKSKTIHSEAIIIWKKS